MGLEARIWAWRLGFGPRDWDLGFKTGIWASRLGFDEGEMEEEKEKIPHICESIGHRPFWSRRTALPPPSTTITNDLVGSLDD